MLVFFFRNIAKERRYNSASAPITIVPLSNVYEIRKPVDLQVQKWEDMLIVVIDHNPNLTYTDIKKNVVDAEVQIKVLKGVKDGVKFINFTIKFLYLCYLEVVFLLFIYLQLLDHCCFVPFL